MTRKVLAPSISPCRRNVVVEEAADGSLKMFTESASDFRARVLYRVRRYGLGNRREPHVIASPLGQIIRDIPVLHTQGNTLGKGTPTIFDGVLIQVIPDFVLSHRLSSETWSARAFLVMPLFPLLRRSYSAVGKTMPREPSILPSPKVRWRDGDAFMEYTIRLQGPKGFELEERSAEVRDLDGKGRA